MQGKAALQWGQLQWGHPLSHLQDGLRLAEQGSCTGPPCQLWRFEQAQRTVKKFEAKGSFVMGIQRFGFHRHPCRLQSCLQSCRSTFHSAGSRHFWGYRCMPMLNGSLSSGMKSNRKQQFCRRSYFQATPVQMHQGCTVM